MIFAYCSMNSMVSVIVRKASDRCRIAVARQTALPVWRKQPQRVPPFGPPRLASSPRSDHVMIERLAPTSSPSPAWPARLRLLSCA